MLVLLLSLFLSGLPTAAGEACPGLQAPVDAVIVRHFAPVGRFGGHWGVDFGADPDTPVRAAGPGMVTFAGDVAGVLSVTVDHGGGLRTSYSYLSEITVSRGQPVAAGGVVGRSGLDHDVAAVHFSVRVGDVYRDPEDWLRCLEAPAPALSLIPTLAA